MTISVGDRLPEASFFIMTDDGPAAQSGEEYFKGKKTALFAVPGAFTPTCHMNHAPGFIATVDDFKAKGVDQIACVSVNDIFVLNAWNEQLGGKGKIEMLADGNGSFAKALGLELDGSGFGLGNRSLRYSMLVDDGVVTALNVEETPSEANVSNAENLLKAL